MIIKRHRSLPPNPKSSVVAIGKFDGIHIGHQLILKKLSQIKNQKDLRSVLISFYSPPVAYFNSDKTFLKVHSFRHKIKLLKESGLDQLQLFNFNQEFSRITAEEFIVEILHKQLDCKYLLIGKDAAIGHNRVGNSDYLKTKLPDYDINLEVIELINNNHHKVGSRLLLDKIKTGDLDEFKKMTKRDFSFYGKVIKGKQLARKLGFPTANLPTNNLALPPFGVYSSTTILNNKSYPSITNIGIKPTYSGKHSSLIETHLINYTGKDFYNQKIEVKLNKFIRSERKFSSPDELKTQIARDISDCA